MVRPPVQRLSARLGSRRRWLGATTVVLLLGVVSAVMLGFTFRLGEQHISRDVPLDTAIAELRVSLGLSHLWLEEHLTGDPTVLVDRDVEAQLERAESLMQVLLEGGRVDEVWTIEDPMEDPVMRAELERTQVLLLEFRALSAERLEHAASAGPGSEMDAEYDGVFRRLFDESLSLRRRVEERMVANQRHGHLLLNGILILWGFVVLLVLIAAIGGELRGREVELALRRSEERSSTTLHSIGDAVITTDQWGRVTFLNRAAEDLTGWSLEQAEGQHITVIRRLRADARGLVPQGALQEAMREGRVVTVADLSLVGGGDRTYEVEETAAPIVDEAGVQTGVVVVLRDISERKRISEELRQRDAQLQQSQKLEAVGRLASGLAHDINNYLAAITVECDLLRMLHREDEVIATRVEIIVDSVFRASSLIRRLLAFSRKQPSKPAVVALDRIVDDMQGMCKRLLGDDILFSWDSEPGLWNVKIDPANVEQVLVNLLVNAGEAMPQGGKISISARNVRECDIPRTASPTEPDRPAECVMLRVTDTGSGIPEELKEKIFEPFFTTKEASGSSGLGLSTVYSIVTQNGGFVRVESEEGRGTTFEIYLPRCREERSRVVAVMDQLPDPIRPCSLLLVEDNGELRESTRAYLEAMGYRVTLAVDGEAALDAVHHSAIERYEVLVTDLLMPRMRGRELVRQLWQEGWSGCVVLISAQQDEASVNDLTSRAGVAFLSKPFASAALVRKIEELRRKASSSNGEELRRGSR